jgi:hypothetical protein
VDRKESEHILFILFMCFEMSHIEFSHMPSFWLSEKPLPRNLAKYVIK